MSAKMLDVKEYPETAHLMREVEATFKLGYDVVELVDEERTVCWMLKPPQSNRSTQDNRTPAQKATDELNLYVEEQVNEYNRSLNDKPVGRT